jgi:hypothetical protein
MKIMKLVLALAASAAFFVCPALAQNPGTITSHAFAVGKGPGTNGFTSVLCAQAQIAIGQNAADPICRTLAGDVTIDANGSTFIGANKVNNANLATMPASTVKCNPNGSTGNAQDCTLTNLVSIGLATSFVNTFTTNHTIATTDCGGILQMGTGATGQLTVTLPSTAGFTGTCPITVYNHDGYTQGVSTGKILSGFPASAYYILYPKQSLDIAISGGAWVVTRQAGRWQQATANQYVSNSGSNTTNDCLSAANPCLTINGAYSHYSDAIDSRNSQPTITIACGTYPETVSIQGFNGGISVLFLVGASTSSHCVNWRNATGAGGAALLVGDLGIVEIQNIYFDCSGCTGTNYAIFMHQHAILDILTGVEFGTFGAGTMIACDSNAKINMPQSFAISAGAGFFMDLGPSCVVNWANPGSGVVISNTPSFTTLVRLNGNATVTMAGLNWSTGPTGVAAGQRWSATGLSYIDQSGVIWPAGSSAGVPAASATPWGGIAK